jgi:hypothetical protein
MKFSRLVMVLLWLGLYNCRMMERKMEGIQDSRAIYNKAMAGLTSVIGSLVGIAGAEHGIFEMLQGNTRPAGFFAAAIGPEQRFWEQGTERALMLIPNYLASGILSVAIGLCVIIWSIAFARRKRGALVLAILSIALWLVGGGFAPVFMSIFAVAAASRIPKPLKAWRSLAPRLRAFLALLWPWSLAACAVLFVFAMANGVFGYPLILFFDAPTTTAILFSIGYAAIGLIVVSFVSALSADTLGELEKEGE